MNEFERQFAPHEEGGKEKEKDDFNIWYIDDDASNLKAYQRLAKIYDLHLIGFQYASDAVKDIKDFLKENKSHLLPRYIIVDFLLDQKADEKNYRTGDKFISTIKELYKIYKTDLPTIIGASGSEESNKVLSESGANITYDKTKLSEFFSNLKQDKENERNRGN